MSGNRYLLDTNAIVALLQGSTPLIALLKDANWVGISVISQIEFLAFSGLSEQDLQLFSKFLNRVEVIDILSDRNLFIEQIIQIRLQYRVKLPDAIVAATALQSGADLITADRGFKKIAGLTIVEW
jgi:tRNA(fMet)-specific endonuclease VapC